MTVANKLPAMTNARQRGQSIIEIAFSLPFILLLTLSIIEMGVVFSTYLAVVNATREGAVFASMYPTLIDQSCHAVPSPNCAGAHDSDLYGGTGNSTTLWQEYRNRIANESFVAVGEVLRADTLISSSVFYIERPIATTTNPGDAVTVTVHYTVSTFSSNMSMPFFGRFGLPNAYHIHYTYALPVRGSQ